MMHYDVQYISSENTGSFVVEDQLGANVLHEVNTTLVDNYELTAGFEETLISRQIHNLRFPGGHVENTLDVTSMKNGMLRTEVRDFLQWCKENSTEELKFEVTFVLPTKSDIPARQMQDFVYALLKDFGDVVVALEIGNEYSIGVEVPNPDRTTHPEHIDGSDFIPAMNEIEYGQSANSVINSVLDAIENLEKTGGIANTSRPHILLQMAETSGAASNYKGGTDSGNFDLANEAILSVIDNRAKASIDGAVVHYYYNVDRKNGKTFDDAVDWREIRRIDERFENFQEHLGRNVDLYVTEWNVVAGNMSQHGAASASILLEMFEFMVRLNVSDAHIWPLQHRTPNNIFGNRSSDGIESAMGGAAFTMLSESLRPQLSVTGNLNAFQSVLSEWSGRGGRGEVEVNHFSSTYQDVLFLSLRADLASTIGIDLGNLTNADSIVSIQRLTIDPDSSDGLSDLADENGQNRLRRRTIDHEELERLETLAFFDDSNPNHVKIASNGSLTTYIPPFETIVPLVSNPKDVRDYYFTAEVDVDPMLIEIESPTLPTRDIYFDVMPYDVVRITVDNVHRVEGDTTNDTLVGGIGRDLLLGRTGDDVLVAGEGDDTLKGGWGNDMLNGDEGNDSIIAGAGDDMLYGGDGNDVLISTVGLDLVFGDAGNDLITLESSQIYGFGFFAHHVVSSRSGFVNWNISIEGFASYSSVVAGGSGIDQLQLSSRNDAFFLDDTIGAQHASLGPEGVARFVEIETIRAGAGNDIIDLTSNRFDLDAGVNIYGEGGNDTLWGTNGDDVLMGGDGEDVLDGALGTDIFTGGEGADAFHFTDPENFTHQITDFSTSQGDVIVLHVENIVPVSEYIFDAQETVLRVLDGNGAIALSVDIGDQAESLAAKNLADVDWFEFF